MTYQKREIPVSVDTRIAALIGWPLGHSASPRMHNGAYAAMGLDAIYLPVSVEPGDMAAVVGAMAAMGYMGCNVTIPYKVKIMELLDELDPSAAGAGAVNTVLFKGDRRIGYNTDGTGFVRALRERAGFEPQGKRCLIVGAGGAARGVALVACSRYTDNLYEYTPMQIKQAVVGYGKADKHQVQTMVKMLLGMKDVARPDDAADALAAAITHAHSARSRELFKIK